MDKREKRAVNDMGTAMKRIVEVLERHGRDHQPGCANWTNNDRAEALVHSVGQALVAVARINRKEEKVVVQTQAEAAAIEAKRKQS